MPRSFLIKKKERKSDTLISRWPEENIPSFTPVEHCLPFNTNHSTGSFQDVLSSLPFYSNLPPVPSPPPAAGPEDSCPVPCKPSPQAHACSAATAPGSPTPSAGFQDGVTVGYTYDAFFISDGRSCKKTPSLVSEPLTRPRYTCNECGKDYATSSNLSRHKQTHRSAESGLAKHCPHCEKVYVSMPALSMHILTHSLKHTCTVCNKAFSRPWLLQGHMRSHTGEKPYGCAHCGKAFADRSNLRAHMQTHSSFKSYHCKRCNKSFALKSYLNKHYESSCFRDDTDSVSMASSCEM